MKDEEVIEAMQPPPNMGNGTFYPVLFSGNFYWNHPQGKTIAESNVSLIFLQEQANLSGNSLLALQNLRTFPSHNLHCCIVPCNHLACLGSAEQPINKPDM